MHMYSSWRKRDADGVAGDGINGSDCFVNCMAATTLPVEWQKTSVDWHWSAEQPHVGNIVSTLVLQKAVFASLPRTQRGTPIVLGGDPKGENFVYTNGNSVIIRSITNPASADVYTEHSTAVVVAKYSPSRFYIASADQSGKVRIWDTVNKEHILKAEYQPIVGVIKDLAWSNDSQRIVIVGEGRERFGHVFMADTGTSVGEISGHGRPINSCDFKSSRPFRIATGSEDNCVGIFEGPPFKFKMTKQDHAKYVQCVRYSPNGELLASGGFDGKLFLYDAKTSELVGQIGDPAHKGGIYGLCWSPDSKQLLTASGDKTCRIWDVATKQSVAEFVMGDSVDDQQVSCLWQGEHLLTVSLSGFITYLNVNDPRENERISGQGHGNQVNDLTVTASGKVISCGIDDSLRGIDPSSNNYDPGLHTPLGSQPRGVAAVLADAGAGDAGITVVAACVDQVAVVRGGRKIASLPIDYEGLSVAIGPIESGDVVVGGQDNKVHIYSLSKDGTILTPKKELEHLGAVVDLHFSPDGQFLATADSYRKVMVYRLPDYSLAHKSDWGFHTAKVNCVAWSPNSARVASGSLDTSIMIWSMDKPSKHYEIKNAHAMSQIVKVAWIDDVTLVSVGQDSNTKLWNIPADLICGTLHSVDQYLNIKLTDISVTDPEKYPHMILIVAAAALYQSKDKGKEAVSTMMYQFMGLEKLMEYLARLLEPFFRLFRWLTFFRDPSIGNKNVDPSKLEINVRNPGGKCLLTTIDKSSSVAEMKKELAPRLCPPAGDPETIRVIFAGKELPDQLTLEECDFGPKTVIHVVFGKGAGKPADHTEVSPKLLPEILATSLAEPPSIRGEDEVSVGDVSSEKLDPVQSEEEVNSSSVSSDVQVEKRRVNTFFVLCSWRACAGKLRVRCDVCKEGAITVLREPESWQDVLIRGRVHGICENSECNPGQSQEQVVEFFFKCAEHGDADVVPLPLVRDNTRDVPCLACTSVENPVLVFSCALGHVVCLECFVMYCSTRLNDRQFVVRDDGYSVGCPVGCGNSWLDRPQYFKLLGKELYSRYQTFAAEDFVLRSGGVLCPQPGCGMGILLPEGCGDFRRIVCDREGGCGYVFCRDCLSGYHIGPCLSSASSATAAATTGAGDAHRSTQSSFGIAADRVGAATWDADAKTVRLLSKPCPSCRVATERDGGCMHMTCRCGYNWCWVCQTEWTRDCMASHWFL
ncbi:unnamed protein product [Notodromas monacha]|uniref:E3 ubiquitin-protein ligase parkin n=1 Tax=Notodromas monacha TaxID=399045 RepID=A0A7R9BJ52_9CRUS|nr:unnamed protein product [Notodromas monacha]CAG0914909.1 unnamed protein product [Notodromas monacha]